MTERLRDALKRIKNEGMLDRKKLESNEILSGGCVMTVRDLFSFENCIQFTFYLAFSLIDVFYYSRESGEY